MTDIGWQTATPRISLAGPGDYFELLKPRVMSLVVFTAWVGQTIAPHRGSATLDAIALFAIALGAGASGALNQWWDADIDAVMSRTRGRPIPSGRLTSGDALAFGTTLAVTSVILLGLAANWFAASLLAFTIFFYLGVYTIGLKRRTVENIVIGGAAGALPPVVAWAAATGSLTLAPLLLFALIFVWTPPHFWSLALVRCDDYARAGVPMLPVIKGAAATRRRILAYSILLWPTGVLPYLFGVAGPIFGAVAALSGAVFVGLAIAVLRAGDGAGAKRACGRLFGFSILHLAVLFAVIAGERLLTLA